MTNIWPVIHITDLDKALYNAEVAYHCGATGVFLIHMTGEDDLIDPIAGKIRKCFPDLRLGVNYLSLSAKEALVHSINRGYDATWSDRSGVRSDRVEPFAHELAELLVEHPQHLFFGSVAFKYQPNDPDPARAAVLASQLGFLPTTSGPATGHPPDIAKLDTMYRALSQAGYSRLALASGASPQNIALMAPMLSDVLISTGISAEFHTFDPALLELMISAVS